MRTPRKRSAKRSAPAKKKKAPAKHAGGRPTKFRPEYVEQARKLCHVLAATEEEVAAVLGVTRRTLLNWRNEHPELDQAMQLGKDAPNERVVKSLYHRAIGYTHESEKIFVHNGRIIRAVTKQHYPPDTAAGIWWTKNRMPDEWRERREFIPGDGDEAPPPVKIEVAVVDGRRKRA